MMLTIKVRAPIKVVAGLHKNGRNSGQRTWLATAGGRQPTETEKDYYLVYIPALTILAYFISLVCLVR